MAMFPGSPMLLSTLAGMRRLRRGVVLAACLGVLGWLLLAATHRHDITDAPQHQGGQHCLLCLGSPTGAAPPVLPVVLLPPPPLAPPLVPPAARVVVAAPLSSYLSRGPPAV
jgi:hypothetical protein